MARLVDYPGGIMSILSKILAGILTLGGVAAYIYNLVHKNQDLVNKLAQKDTQVKLQEWSDKISDIESKITVEERNYEDLKKAALSDSDDESGGNS